MEVTRLTGSDLEGYSEGANLSDLIRDLESRTAAEGRVICRIEVNGLKMDELDEARFAKTPIKDVTEVILQTENVDVLLEASISSVREWMERLKAACVETSDIFREKSGSEEQKKFAGLMDAYRELIQTLSVLKQHIADRAQNAEFEEQWKTSELHTSNAVTELYEAYEQKDRILVADILEYELYNCLDRWAALIRLPD